LLLEESAVDTKKAEEQAIKKRRKSRRYGGKYKGRGKYKPKDPHNGYVLLENVD
jgi:hypothetical protein